MGEVHDPEQQYSLRWNDFHASIISSFRHLRDEEDFVDVTLACDGCSFTAHKVVLSACSPYFRRLLKANPCQHPIVILRDVKEKDMESLLRFMYNGEVHIGQEQLSDFLKTAQMLQVRGLADVPTKENQKPPSPVEGKNCLGQLQKKETRGMGDQSPSQPPLQLLQSRMASNSLPWSQSSDMRDSFNDDDVSPPPKRNRFSPSPAPSATHNNGGEQMMRDSLLGQALESAQLPPSAGSSHQNKGTSESSLQAQSTGEDSNSSDTAMSDRGGHMTDIVPKTEPSEYGSADDNQQLHHHGNGNGIGLDTQRTPPFPAALLGLQGIPGLLPGPSGLHSNNQDGNFGPWSALGGSVPHDDGAQKPICPECGRMYSTTSNLKQHIANVHSSTNYWEPCQICGKRFKTKQYLHTHLLQTHGIRQRSIRNQNLLNYQQSSQI